MGTSMDTDERHRSGQILYLLGGCNSLNSVAKITASGISYCIDDELETVCPFVGYVVGYTI